MTKGYTYLAAGAGFMLIAGFFLPWLGKNPFHFSGFSFAMLGYWFLHILPLSGMAVLYFALAKKRQRPIFMLYPGMAGLLTFVLLISSLFLSDSGVLLIELPIKSMEFIRFKQGASLILFNPIKDIGLGSILSFTGITILCLLPFIYRNDFQKTIGKDPHSYKSVIKEQDISFEYKRFTLVLSSLAVLIITYSLCDVSPMKLWENRGNAKEYLFGRTLSQGDMDYINAQKERAPQIEASGRAEEYMANKYRGLPFSKQPGPAEKAKEREDVKQSILVQMSEKEKNQLRKETEKTAIKDKKGGYFPPETSLVKIKGYIVALIETVAIAIWGTMLALICAIPVSFFAAKNTLKLIIPSDDMKSRSMRAGISFGVRRFLDSCRGFNEFVMALIFVAVIGLGPYAGILALWIHTFGILGKVFSEQIEAIETGQVEALVSTGATATQIITFSVMPQVLSVLVSYTLLRFESNVRSAAILGFVGAGGIGFLIFDKLNGYLFKEVCSMMIIIIMTVGVIDHLCSKIRMKFI